MNKQFRATSGLLPYPVIVAAITGNVNAINAVLKHYGGYIRALATKQLYDECGQPHICVDEEMKRRASAAPALTSLREAKASPLYVSALESLSPLTCSSVGWKKLPQAR